MESQCNTSLVIRLNLKSCIYTYTQEEAKIRWPGLLLQGLQLQDGSRTQPPQAASARGPGQ